MTATPVRPERQGAFTPTSGSGRAAATTMLFFDTPSHHFVRDRWFDSGTNPTGGDDLQAPWRHVRDAFGAEGIECHTLDLMDELAGPDVQKVVVAVSGQSDYEALARRNDVTLSAYIALECPAVEPRIYRRLPKVAPLFKRVLSWTDGEHLLPFTGTPVTTERFCWPQSYDTVHAGFWERTDRGFLTMINSNKLPRLYLAELYTKRLAAIEFFHRYGELDLYGNHWNKRPSRMGESIVPLGVRHYYRKSGLEDLVWSARQALFPNPVYKAAAAAWKGTAKSKADTLSRYDFTLCFENQAVNGWMTEKMFDCLFAGTIPVYLGATDVERLVPPECFVDVRQFAGLPQLRSYLKSLSPADVLRMREAGRAFVESSAFDPFRRATFTAMLRRHVREDVGV